VVLTRARAEPDQARTEPGWRGGVALGALIALGIGLRCWNLGGTRLSFDETFTAVLGRLPITALISYVGHHDAHPPLDYLMRVPLARAGATEGWFRLPSAVEATAALLVAAWWWRPLGRLGLIATGLLAISSYAVTYAHDARMYAALGLAGVVVAAAACTWLERPSAGALAAASVGVFAALWLQGGAMLVLPAALAVPWLRRDRAAWQWRAAIAGAAAVWAAAWGPDFLVQLGLTRHSWVPLTDAHTALVSVNELVDLTPALAVLVLGLVAAGACCIGPGPLRRVTGILGWGVIATYLVVGWHFHVLLPRSMAFAAWAPVVALAALCETALRRFRALGMATLALVVVLLLPSALFAANPAPAPHAAAFAAVERVVGPGDEVVMTPPFLWTMPAWYFGVVWHQHGSAVERDDLQAEGTEIGDGPPTGRVWLVVSVAYTAHTGGLPPCAPPQRLDQYVVYCLTGSAAAARSAPSSISPPSGSP
jgi:hypothetical protein